MAVNRRQAAVFPHGKHPQPPRGNGWHDPVIQIMYRWHRFEQGSIIDFDLIQLGSQYPGAAQSREEVREQLQRHLTETGLRRTKVNASLYYLRALMGEDIPFTEYVENTMGITPQRIPEHFLQEQLEKMTVAYGRVGYPWTRDGILRYQQEQALSKDDVRAHFRHDAERLVPLVKAWLGIAIDVPYKISFVDEDAYWTNWISTDDTGSILLRFNMNERQKWVKGVTEFQVLHELGCHAIQSALLKNAIREGHLDPLLGLTNAFSFEEFQMEGLADTLFYFLPENPYSSEFALISQCYSNFWFLVWNNGHIMANEGQPIDKITAYLQTYLPHLTVKEIEKSVSERTHSPLDRTYQYVYGIAAYHFRRIANSLDNPASKKNFIQDKFTNIYTPEQILSRSSALAEKADG